MSRQGNKEGVVAAFLTGVVESQAHGMVKKTCSKHSSGFTLIELLVALVLLGLVFLLLLGGTQFGMKVWSSKEDEVYDTFEVLAVQNLLRRVLSEARPIIAKVDKSDRRRVFFEGTNNSIRFVAPITKQFGMSGLFDIAVYLTEGDLSGKRFAISWRRFRTAVSPDALGTIDLMKGVTEINFNYFGSREKGQPARWYSDWQDVQYLPDLIRVRLSQGDQTWPELVVATKVRSANLTLSGTNPEDQAGILP
jgi:general secretion pathway protein J